MTIPPIELAVVILIAALAGFAIFMWGYEIGWQHGYRRGYGTAERILIQRIRRRTAEIEAKIDEYAARMEEVLGVRS